MLASALCLATSLQAEPLRIATFNTELDRNGPGLLLRDIRRGDPQVAAIAQIIVLAAPDILVLQGVDYDHGQATLTALRDKIGVDGVNYPYLFALRPNTGMATGLDTDGDGQTGQARDAQGYGLFAGQGGMAVLSRHPILTDQVLDFTGLLWRDLPGAVLPKVDGRPFPSEAAQAVQRLASVGQWVVPVDVNGRRVTLLTFHATPPVFDGPEDRNGLRNRDELRFWQVFLDGAFGPAPDRDFVLIGDTNQDPVGGEGLKDGINGLLRDPRLQDPQPDNPPTVDWVETGPMRVDYILPSADLRVVGAGLSPRSDGTASRHSLVWTDLLLTE